MATSGSTNYNQTRDQIISRALRICGAIGQAETPSSDAVVEASIALNSMVKEFQGDGMPLWGIYEYSFAPTQGVAAYTVGTGYTISAPAPLKVIQAWYHDVNSGADTPMVIITREEYTRLSVKTSQGSPNQLFYQTPSSSGAEMQGMVYIFTTPDANFAANKLIKFQGQRPYEDFDNSTDNPDFPTYWINAITWCLADQLSYEYGVGLSERAMIAKKAMYHKNEALMYGVEEGSLRIQPGRIYG